jgi:predicted nucleotidyltransferase
MDRKQIKERLLQALKNEQHIADIKSVAIFGSHVSGQATGDSDVDVLIEFEPNATIGFFEFVRIQRNFTEALGKTVDLLTPEAISKYIRPQILRQAEVIYER